MIEINESNNLDSLLEFIDDDSILIEAYKTLDKYSNGLFWDSKKCKLYFSEKEYPSNYFEHKILSNLLGKKLSVSEIKEEIIKEISFINQLIINIDYENGFNQYLMSDDDMETARRVVNNTIDFKLLEPYSIALLIFTGRPVQIDEFTSGLIKAIRGYLDMNIRSVESFNVSKALRLSRFDDYSSFNIDYSSILIHKEYIYNIALTVFEKQCYRFDLDQSIISDKTMSLFKIKNLDSERDSVIKDIISILGKMKLPYNYIDASVSSYVKIRIYI